MTFDEWWISEFGIYWNDAFTHSERDIAKDAWDAATKAECEACLDAINLAIKPGHLTGNGLDKTAERNGLIIASNLIFDRYKK